MVVFSSSIFGVPQRAVAQVPDLSRKSFLLAIGGCFSFVSPLLFRWLGAQRVLHSFGVLSSSFLSFGSFFCFTYFRAHAVMAGDYPLQRRTSPRLRVPPGA